MFPSVFQATGSIIEGILLFLGWIEPINLAPWICLFVISVIGLIVSTFLGFYFCNRLQRYKQKAFAIHEEFTQDPISEEGWEIPIQLPCGKLIDRATLNQILQEARYHGREPKCPFSSLPLSPNIDCYTVARQSVKVANDLKQELFH